MKKILFYFDHTVKNIFTEKESDTGEKKLTLSSIYNFVYPAEIVARVIDIDDEAQLPTRIDPGYTYYNIEEYRTIKADTGIYFDQITNAYKANSYGFVIFDGAKIRWLSPLRVSKEKLKAYFTVFPTKFGKIPSYQDIEEELHNEHILSRLPEKKIIDQLEQINPEEKKIFRLLVAQGKAPVNGHEEYFIPIINIEKKAGEIMPDGRINFKETGSIIQVVKDQELLERIPEVKPVDGYDIFGDKSSAEIVEPEGYQRGENIIQSGHDENIYLSAIDGCLDIQRKLISVLPIAVISGDVNYETGNIDFNGSVQISGSVLPGFSVKATGDVFIGKSVDDSFIEAGGDITVKMGVVGKESVKLISGGSVTAKFLLNAKVEAAKDIIVGDSIINCDVFANNTISVVAKHGKIIGGKTTALYQITVNVAGAINETGTALNVGRNLYIEKELAEVHKEISNWRQQVAEVMNKLKLHFGEAVFENPKEFIAILPPVKKKNCLLLLKELSNTNKELKKLVEVSKEIQGKLKLEREPFIIVKNKVFPGTIINVKKTVRKIEKVEHNVKYFEDPKEKVIRFTPAV